MHKILSTLSLTALVTVLPFIANAKNNAYPYQKTALISISGKSKIVTSTNRSLKNSLSSNPNIKLVSPSDTLSCNTKSCALREARKVNADRAVYGKVTSFTKERTLSAGEKGANKYLLVDKEIKYYITTIYIIDSKTGKTLKRISFTATASRNNNRLKQSIDNIQKYFKRYPDKSKTFIKEPGTLTFSGGAGILGFKAAGSFSDICSQGYGGSLFLNMQGIITPNDLIRFSLSAMTCSSPEADIDSYWSYNYTLSLGYQYNITPIISLIPIVGGGLIHHSITKKNGSAAWFIDPLMAISLEGIYHVNAKTGIFLRPQVDIFFEKSNTGYYTSLHTGIVYNF